MYSKHYIYMHGNKKVRTSNKIIKIKIKIGVILVPKPIFFWSKIYLKCRRKVSTHRKPTVEEEGFQLNIQVSLLCSRSHGLLR